VVAARRVQAKMAVKIDEILPFSSGLKMFVEDDDACWMATAEGDDGSRWAENGREPGLWPVTARIAP
jgi:hypothetical protein